MPGHHDSPLLLYLSPTIKIITTKRSLFVNPVMKRNKDMRSFFIPIGKRNRENEGDVPEEREQVEPEEREQEEREQEEQEEAEEREHEEREQEDGEQSEPRQREAEMEGFAGMASQSAAGMWSRPCCCTIRFVCVCERERERESSKCRSRCPVHIKCELFE